MSNHRSDWLQQAIENARNCLPPIGYASTGYPAAESPMRVAMLSATAQTPRCRDHSDCLEHPMLGEACLKRRGLRFARGAPIDVVCDVPAGFSAESVQVPRGYVIESIRVDDAEHLLDDIASDALATFHGFAVHARAPRSVRVRLRRMHHWTSPRLVIRRSRPTRVRFDAARKVYDVDARLPSIGVTGLSP